MPYRFEAASTGRAGCSNKECKDNKVKIAKGELRVGSWVENERFQSWTWRHWGCTTPKVLENIKTAWQEMQGDSDEKDYSNLDGYDELPEEYQMKVRNALEQGHVDSEDWKGDAEMNIPGSMGFRVRKKKADQAKKDDKEPAKEADVPEAEPKARKARAKKPPVIPDISSGSEEQKPIKKRASRAKKAATDDASDADAEVKPKKRVRSANGTSTEKASRANTKAKRKATDEGDSETADEKPKPRGRPPKAQKIQAEDGVVPEKPKRGRKKAQKNSEEN